MTEEQKFGMIKEKDREGQKMDLFDYMKETTLENESPLASRMRLDRNISSARTNYCTARSRQTNWDRLFFTDLREQEKRRLQK